MSKRKPAVASRRLQRLSVKSEALAKISEMLKEYGAPFDGVASEITAWRNCAGEFVRFVAHYGPGERVQLNLGKRTSSISFSISIATKKADLVA